MLQLGVYRRDKKRLESIQVARVAVFSLVLSKHPFCSLFLKITHFDA